MPIDQDRIRTIIKAKHSYYGTHEVVIRQDTRWFHGPGNFISEQLSPAMNVLDIGCGNGSTLLDLSPKFANGIGLDFDPEHIQMAEKAKRTQGIQNVEFILLDYPREVARLQPEAFDLVFSLRGPLPNSPQGIQAALHLLRPEGMLFCEEIGELHDHEVREIFEDRYRSHQTISRVEQVKLALKDQGVEVRLTADLFTKWCYPDGYAWLQYQSNLWAWLGVPLPEPDDPRISLFMERNTNATGEIETTHHVVWVAGVKLRQLPHF